MGPFRFVRVTGAQPSRTSHVSHSDLRTDTRILYSLPIRNPEPVTVFDRRVLSTEVSYHANLSGRLTMVMTDSPGPSGLAGWIRWRHGFVVGDIFRRCRVASPQRTPSRREKSLPQLHE